MRCLYWLTIPHWIPGAAQAAMTAAKLVVKELPLGQCICEIGGMVYNQLQHFVHNNENAVYLARRIRGLTNTAKLAAEYIDSENEQLKGLQELLVETVGFLTGIITSAFVLVIQQVLNFAVCAAPFCLLCSA
jgi:hypothetical protein